jgi:hypothetical protein
MKHCIIHIHCLDHPGVLKIIRALIARSKIFTGYKIATLSKSSRELKVFELVSSILTKLGFEVIEVENSEMREVQHFFDISLPLLLSKADTGLLYYCHSKGVTYHPDSDDGKAVSVWTDTLLKHTLYEYIKMPLGLKKYSCFGSCLIPYPNFLPDEINEKFSYAGTFFWINLSKLKNIEFIYSSKFYLEGLPGLVCDISEAYNVGPIFSPTESPYKLSTWIEKGIYNDV